MTYFGAQQKGRKKILKFCPWEDKFSNGMQSDEGRKSKVKLSAEQKERNILCLFPHTFSHLVMQIKVPKKLYW